MATIRSKRDVEAFMDSFGQGALWDEVGKKRYLVFSDKERGGIWTLMQYPDGEWSVHGKGDVYCDPVETQLTAEEAELFVWKHRAAINRSTAESA